MSREYMSLQEQTRERIADTETNVATNETTMKTVQGKRVASMPNVEVPDGIITDYHFTDPETGVALTDYIANTEVIWIENTGTYTLKIRGTDYDNTLCASGIVHFLAGHKPVAGDNIYLEANKAIV